MFDRIESITNAAVWDGYSGRAGDAPNFARYNLIYGWNASGKTTLSRVFGLFSPPAVSKLPAGARARIRMGSEVLDSSKEQDQGRVSVCVFNRDFIDSNLKADYTEAPALFIVGKDNIRLSNRIASLTRRRERVGVMYRAVQKAQSEAKSAREKAATDLARECANMLGVRDFRAPNLKTLAGSMPMPAERLLDDVALQEAVSQARDQSEFARINNLPVVVGSPPLGEEVARLLSQTPKRSTLKRLADDPALSDWVRSGLRFHEHDATCAFCGGDAARALEEYSKHFSDEYRRQHAAITSALASEEQPKTLPTYPHELQWVPEVRAKVQAAKEQLEAWVAQENETRRKVAETLRKKLADMEAVIVLDEGRGNLELAPILAKLQEAKEEHNRACKELSASRQAAAAKVKEHFAARYMLDPGAPEAIETVRGAAEKLEHVKGVGQKIAAQKDQANEELQRSSVAASQLNELLQRLLGPHICVEQAQDGRIQFLREGRPATNMSDGERTAISLSYFLVSLEQNGQRIEDLVVFVDDPICSLDANHIYDVAHLILVRLKECRQLFVSTHNAEFFNTIKQHWTNRGGGFKKEHEGYLVHREIGGLSQLFKLPKHLAKFRSDYHHVFYCLRQVLGSTSQEVDEYLNCPNLLRRLLEMYLGFRRPSFGSFQAKLDILFDDEAERAAVARYVDEGSHSTSTLRLLEFSDFPAMSKSMVERVLTAMKSVDPDHYDALMEQTA